MSNKIYKPPKPRERLTVRKVLRWLNEDLCPNVGFRRVSRWLWYTVLGFMLYAIITNVNW